MPTQIIGRSSSHFTRVARIFAHELNVPYAFSAVTDLLSNNPEDYGGNPGLRLPVLLAKSGEHFGSLNICRALARLAPVAPRIVWPEQPTQALVCNAQELVLHGMAVEVSLVMNQLAGGADNAYQAKSRQVLLNCLQWLEQHAQTSLELLPKERALSYLEITLFCFISHLQFRKLADLSAYPALLGFTASFSQRPSAQQTPFHFDAQPAPGTTN